MFLVSGMAFEQNLNLPGNASSNNTVKCEDPDARTDQARRSAWWHVRSLIRAIPCVHVGAWVGRLRYQK